MTMLELLTTSFFWLQLFSDNVDFRVVGVLGGECGLGIYFVP